MQGQGHLVRGPTPHGPPVMSVSSAMPVVRSAVMQGQPVQYWTMVSHPANTATTSRRYWFTRLIPFLFVFCCCCESFGPSCSTSVAVQITFIREAAAWLATFTIIIFEIITFLASFWRNSI
jgi:hypothetical protein